MASKQPQTSTPIGQASKRSRDQSLVTSLVDWTDSEDDHEPECISKIYAETSPESVVSWTDDEIATPIATKSHFPVGLSCDSKVSWTPDSATSKISWTPDTMTPIRGTKRSGSGTPVNSKNKNPKKISFMSVQAPDNDSFCEGATNGEPLFRYPTFLRKVPDLNENFSFIKIIGRGTFGVVILCSPKKDPSVKFAMKFLIPTCGSNSAFAEIHALQKIKKHDSIIELLTTTRYMDQVVLVFPYFEHDSFSNLVKCVEADDIKHYMINLLRGLAYVHSLQIIHRDVKPNNYLYNKQLRTGKLIDFGICRDSTIPVCTTTQSFRKPSMFSKANKERNRHTCIHDCTSVCSNCMSRRAKKFERAGTPGYRAPEVLLGYCSQTNAIDVLSSGVVLLSLLSGRYPFFRERSDLQSLAEIISVFGYEKCVDAADKLGISLITSEHCPAIPLDLFCQRFTSNKRLIQTLNKLLTVNPLCRLSADEIMCFLESC